LYTSVVKLKIILSQAEKEYYGYTNLSERADTSIDEIYYREYKKQKITNGFLIIASILSGIMFFFVEPISKI